MVNPRSWGLRHHPNASWFLSQCQKFRATFLFQKGNKNLSLKTTKALIPASGGTFRKLSWLRHLSSHKWTGTAASSAFVDFTVTVFLETVHDSPKSGPGSVRGAERTSVLFLLRQVGSSSSKARFRFVRCERYPSRIRLTTSDHTFPGTLMKCKAASVPSAF